MLIEVKNQDLLAFDFSTARFVDQDGHLHVSQTAVTKACVNPYRGSEINGSERLGLNPDKIYKLFRDPDELEKAASSWNNKPLLYLHRRVNARDHDHIITVGTVSGPVWTSPYIRVDLTCWDGQAIDTIQDDSRKELSSAYHYKCVMEPGVFQGEAFDARMVGMACNHVALCEKGRAGPDVFVSDSAMRTAAPVNFGQFKKIDFRNFR
jgi:hypothetical protein